jgi:hypothetical protein
MFRPSNLLPVQLFVTCLTLLLLTLQACSTDSGPGHPFTKGNGTEENPYWISDIDQLQAINDPEFLDKHFVQVRDIDASASEKLQNGSGFKFIGDAEKPFTGSYNGNGFSIRNLKINFNKFDPHNGMFGFVKNGLLQNITIDNQKQLDKVDSGIATLNRIQTQSLSKLSNIQKNDVTDMEGVGGLVGMNEGGTIRNCHFIGPVSAFGFVAGLVGFNTGTIEGSSFDGQVSAGISSASGLVTYNSGFILRSSAEGHISGQVASGFVRNNFGEIHESYADIDTGGNISAAGFVMNNEGIIHSSFVTGKINGYRYSGSFVGNNRGLIEDSYIIADHEIELYEDDSPDTLSEFGGVAVRNDSEGVIRSVFLAGTITVDGDFQDLSLFGAFAGENSGMIDHGYWDKESTGMDMGVDQGDPENATGLTTTQMTGQAAQENMPEFDWVNTWTTTPDGYPMLRWQQQ